MIGIVVVSHSRPLAEAAVQLVHALLPAENGPTIVVAAGTAEGALGTDVAAISLAIASLDSPDGVLVVLDLGSAILSTELAVEFLDPAVAERVVISSAPLVEGLLAAAAAAASGADLPTVAAEARLALIAKTTHLDGAEPPTPLAATPARPVARRPARPTTLVWRTSIDTVHGLHIRPAAAIVTALREVDADVAISNASTGVGPVPASSLARLAALEIKQGQILEARITGAEASLARDVLADLAAGNFGEADTGTRPRAARPVLPVVEPGPDLPFAGASGSQIVVGPIHRRTSIPSVDGYHPLSPKGELTRFTAAVATVQDYLDALAITRPLSADILTAQSLIAGDRELAHDVVGRITEGFSAVDAVTDLLTRTARSIDGLTDPYLRERAQDVRSVRRLLLLALMDRPLADDEPGEPCVWLTDELDAATASGLDARLCLGVITTTGGFQGHGVLTAESRGIPVLAGRAEARGLSEGRIVAFDPVSRELWVDPDDALLAELAERNAARTAAFESAQARAHDPAYTLDGHRILVEANVSSLADARAGALAGAEGSGVVRTEILFAARSSAPDAEEQAAVYRAIGATLGGPITIRTFDAGGDKPLAYLPTTHEANPALGVRGIRLMPSAREQFRQQLRGIVMAARDVAVRVLFPMITVPGEMAWARGVLDDVVRELGPVDLPVGMMIEVPAAALRAADFAGLVDFVSIGTNDLAQYTLASDRTAPTAAHPDPTDSPAVWDLIRLTCEGLPGVPVAVCGNLASDPTAVGRLLELGVTELSVRPPLVAEIKQAVRRS